MANVCSFTMRVTGSVGNVEDFTDRLYDVAADGGRGLYEFTRDDLVVGGNGVAYADVWGSCPWSIDSAFGLSDEGVVGGWHIVRERRDCGLVRESRSRNLLVEVYGRETDIGFDEHYVIRGGRFEVAEVAKSFDETVEALERNPNYLDEVCRHFLMSRGELMSHTDEWGEHVVIGGFDLGDFSARAQGGPREWLMDLLDNGESDAAASNLLDLTGLIGRAPGRDER